MSFFIKKRMARFHTLEVADINRETADSISIAFRIPRKLRQDFAFKQGQYLTLKLDANGEQIRRSYSICSSPLDTKEIRIAVKRVAGGRASVLLNEKLKRGDKLEVMVPMGNFTTELSPKREQHYVAFAAGSGITPIFSILTTVLRIEHRSRFTLFYGNSNLDSIIFRQKLDELTAKYPDRLRVYHILSRSTEGEKLFTGRITAEKAAELLKAYVPEVGGNEFFICGPEQMMVNVSEALEVRGVDKKRIHIELFTTEPLDEPRLRPAGATGVKTEPAQGAAGPEAFTGVARVKIVLDGEETEIEVPTDGDSILDTAEDAGLDVPYSCKGGVCSTCRAKIQEGRVEMDQNYALSEEEVEAGYVLTCQSHPRTERVVVDYDDQ